MQTVKFLGNSDDVTTCECCGRSNLKSTIALAFDDGDATYYGVTCAARALGRKPTEIKRDAKRADDAIVAAKRAAEHEASAREDLAWQSFLNMRAPAFARSFMGGPDRFRQIEELGGYAAARAAYEVA